MSRKSPERAAWRKHVVETKARDAAAAADNAAATATRKPAERAWSVRIMSAAIVTGACAYVLHAGLMRVAHRLGVVTWVHYDYPVERTVYVNHTAYTSAVSSEYTFSWKLLTLLSIALASFAGRAVWHGTPRAALTRRARWLMAGWVLCIALMIAEIELTARGAVPVIKRLHGWQWYAFTIVWLLSCTYFCAAWGWLMRVCGVPKEDRFTRNG